MGREGGIGKSGDWEWMGGGGNWKTGMISDCYQLQENQRKNGPLAVKTPPPPAWAARLPCWPAVRRPYPRRSLAPSRAALPLLTIPRPMPCPVQLPAARANSSRARSPANPCGIRLPEQMLKRYRNQHSRRRRRGPLWPRSSAGRRSFPRSKWAKWAKVWQGAPLVPSSCPPALLRPCTQTRSMPACQAGRRAKLIFPFRHEKRLSRNNT